jgi:hypothetical protein
VTAKIDNAIIRTKQRGNAVVTMSKLTPHESEATMERLPAREDLSEFPNAIPARICRLSYERRLRAADLLNGSLPAFANATACQGRQPFLDALRLSSRSICAKIQTMKSVFSLALLALATSGAYAQNIEIVSPKHAYTFAYGDAISHQIERDHLTNEMIARVTFSNYPYAGDREARRDEMVDFVFPGLHFDATRNEFFARTRHHARIPIAALHPNFPYAGYKLEPTAKIFLVKRSGHVTVVLNATAQPRDGARWVQLDDNWSLQNLLALGLERLTR